MRDFISKILFLSVSREIIDKMTYLIVNGRKIYRENWFYDPFREGMGTMVRMDKCTQAYNLWWDYLGYLQKDKSHNSWEFFIKKFHEVYRDCKKNKRKMTFADFEDFRFKKRISA